MSVDDAIGANIRQKYDGMDFCGQVRHSLGPFCCKMSSHSALVVSFLH